MPIESPRSPHLIRTEGGDFADEMSQDFNNKDVNDENDYERNMNINNKKSNILKPVSNSFTNNPPHPSTQKTTYNLDEVLNTSDPEVENDGHDNKIATSGASSEKSAPKQSGCGEQPKVVGNKFSFFGKEDKEQTRGKPILDDADIRRQDIISGKQSVDSQSMASLGTPQSPVDQTSASVHSPTSLRKLTDADELKGLDEQQATWLKRINIFTPTNDSSTHHKWKEFRSALLQFSKNKNKRVDSSKARYSEGEQESEIRTRERAEMLVSTLLAGAPASLIAASHFLQDEHDEVRVPLLLPLLGFKLTDVTNKLNFRNRKFRIDLEYGVGPQRLRWSVTKTSKDLNILHSKLKIGFFHSNGFRPYKQIKMPEFPRNKMHSKNSDKLEFGPAGSMINPIDPEINRNDGNDNDSLFSGSIMRRLTRISSLSSNDSHYQQKTQILKIKNEKYKLSMESYLKELCLILTLRPQCNRLFHFFALSPIGVLLSRECGYQGQQGELYIFTSAKAQGWRVGHLKITDLKDMVSRHTTKWFLIRSSYITYVSDINSTTPLEVFLVDSKFKISYRGDDDKNFFSKNDNDDESDFDDSSLMEVDQNRKKISHFVSAGYVITLENNERKLRMVATSKKQFELWINSLTLMQQKSIWSKEHRFGSFAPVRDNCFAQWFVDARDHFWAASSALEMAQDVIYIHDWWLSPELYMRRPANGNQEWRLDRILKRKAEQGVKIFVIIYRNVGTTVSTDSLYTKHSLLDLHENVHVIRSPNQLLQNTYFWAHHEKLLIIDQTVAFLGGIDLCYGRYDSPDHVLVDDSNRDFSGSAEQNIKNPDREDNIKFQTFPGKDYSNPRVKDFFGLDKPYESMYDRCSTPRMPWHDVHMVTAGQIARDLSRHFVQRWNYLLRQKRPSRPTPLLLPPGDFKEEEIESLGLGGTCEVQLLRSSGQWSLGLKEHEQSIQNAYLKLIETSEHFVYIENQFFVTSCAFDGVVIKNRIGDALVDRIIRAHNEGKSWRACIVIPLMPGFESQVDEPDGSSVRVIMQCQFMSISRGSTSIFAKLKKLGIDPDDYIQFFSLRKWGRIGPDQTLVTEQLYIHAKTMIVDDRSVIIGSANINERSMRGVRDSEVAAIVRDRETINTTMNGEPYVAGKFAHTLRMRLMREHLGVAVDILEVVERRFKQLEDIAKTSEGLKAVTGVFKSPESKVLSALVELASRDILNQPQGTNRWKTFQSTLKLNDKASVIPLETDKDNPNDYNNFPAPIPLPLSFNHRAGQENVGIRDKKPFSSDSRVQNNEAHKDDVEGLGRDNFKSKQFKKARVNCSKLLKEWANKAMNENPTDVFLPEFEQVKEVLENEDYSHENDADEDFENYMIDKNRDRLALLKRVAYLQRVAAKEKVHKLEESKKYKSNGINSSGKMPHNQINKDTITASVDVPSANNPHHPNSENVIDNELNVPHHTITEKKSFDPLTPEDGGENIPIVSLEEEDVRALLDPLTPGKINNFSKFIDPYGFEDPLDEEFYEDLWYEHALRNTRIFRLIFHVQPDDEVTTWKEYKEFAKLQGAFSLAQEQEIKFMKEKTIFSSSDDDDDDLYGKNDKRYQMTRNMSHATINFNDIDEDKQHGLLGKAPPSTRKSSSSANIDNYGCSSFQQAESMIQEEEELENNNPKQADNTNGYSDSSANKTSTANVNDPHFNSHSQYNSYQKQQRRRAGTFGTRHKSTYKGVNIFDRETSNRILSEIKGNLVLFPSNWLARELDGNNWFYNTDRIPPIEIYD